MSEVIYHPDVQKYGDLYVSKRFMDVFHLDAGFFDGSLRHNVPPEGMCLALIDLGVRGRIFGTVSTETVSTSPYIFAPDDEDKLEAMQQVLTGSRRFAFSDFNGQVTLQNHTTPVVGRGTLARQVASVVGIYGVRGYLPQISSLPQMVTACSHPELTDFALAQAEANEYFDYPAVAAIFGVKFDPKIYDTSDEPFDPEYDARNVRNNVGGFDHVFSTADVSGRLGPKTSKRNPGDAARIRAAAEEHLAALRKSGWKPTGRYWSTSSEGSRVPRGFLNFTARPRGIDIMCKPGTGTVAVELMRNSHNLCFEVARMAGPYDVLHVRGNFGGPLTTVEPVESHTMGAGSFVGSRFHVRDFDTIPSDNNAHDTVVHGYPVRVQRQGAAFQIVAGEAPRLPKDHLLSDVVITPLLGSLGPTEEAFVLRGLHYEPILVGTATSPTDPQLGRLMDEKLARPTNDSHDPSVGTDGEFGFKDVVVLYIDATTATRFARFDGRALEFIGSGAAVTKSPPPKVVESYRDLGKELAGQPFSVVERAVPYRVPFDVVTRTELYARHKKVREKACKKNNFMSLEYSRGITWGMANAACNRQLALSRVYAVQWDVPVADIPEDEKLPKKLVFKKLLSSYHVESQEGGQTVTYTVKDAGKVAYFISRGVPTSGEPVAEVMAAWGFEDVTPDGLMRENTTQEYELAKLGGAHSTAGLGGNALSFSHLAYANAGYPDLEQMDAQDAYKAILASVNVYGHVGAQLDKAVTRYRVNIPASIVTRGIKLIKPHLVDVPVEETNQP